VEIQATTPRRLWALTRSLPPDAAWCRQGKRWSQQDELAAIAIERNDAWMRVLAIGQGRKVEKVPPVAPIKHPDRTAGQQAANPDVPARMSTRGEIAAFFGKLRR